MKITIFGTFVEGLLSFLSPCVLPLVPLYMAYLSGEHKQVDEEGNVKYNQKAVFLRTVCFVLGVFVVFSLLAISLNSIKEYVDDYKDIITIVGSVVIFIFGLHETGLIEINILNKEASFKNKLHLDKMTYPKAFLFGLFFAFAWTPCIGPMLSNALLLTISEAEGVLYLFVYALGLTLPFIITGFATAFILNFLNKFKKVMKYVLIVAGIVLMGFSIYMFINASNSIVSQKHLVENQSAIEEQVDSNEDAAEQTYAYMLDSTFKDHNGNDIKFSDYNGKYVVLNYIATWCGYCKQEIPYYEEFKEANPDVVCLYVMSPDANNEDVSTIAKFAEEYNLTIPIIVDDKNEIASYLGISSFPTTWVIAPDQSILGYVSGMLILEQFDVLMQNAVEMFESR